MKVTTMCIPLAAVAALAQEPPDVMRLHKMNSEQVAYIGSAGPSSAAAVAVLGAGPADGKVVRNAPYTAESTTEMTRVLADGTRILNRNTSVMARDKEGRTRREHTLGDIGPIANSPAAAPRFVTITDNVAKEVYILNLTEKTAQRVKLGEPLVFRHESREGNTKRIVEERTQMRVHSSTASGDVFTMAVPPPPPGGPMVGSFAMRFDEKNVKTEDLGKQSMEGVLVTGARTTMTIPEGEIGNDRPIVSVSERWYSPDLQMVIYSKTNDPQFGESVYRVSNLKVGEPDAGLFRIPAEFKIQEPSKEPVFMMRKLVPGPNDQD
ncbi:MAG: hypothetical protein IT167_00905 [Bryobacterales bacterium]|nr:hypothetical protein [Bryobacterales bacterium]